MPITHLSLQTHWDREWYEPQAAYRVRLLQLLHDLLPRLTSGDLPAFTLDGQTVLLADALAVDPSLKTPLQEAFARGQLHVGPWFTAPDTRLASFEALCRNLRQGMAEANAWGCTAFTAYLPDSFGHVGALPLLFNHMGLSHTILWRGVPTALAGKPFVWQALGGAGQVLAYALPMGYLHLPLHPQEAPPEALEEGLLPMLTQLHPLPSPQWLPLGGDHLGAPSPQRWAELQAHLPPNVTVGHPHTFMQALDNWVNDSPLPQHTGDLLAHGEGQPFILAGTLSARLYLKQANAALEHRLTQVAEPLLAATVQALGHGEGFTHTLQGLPAPACAALLNEAWQAILLNQAHDTLCGCSVDEVHTEAEVRYQQANSLLTALERRLWAAFYDPHPSPLPEGEGALVFATCPAPVGQPCLVPVTHRQTPDEPLPPWPVQWISQSTQLCNEWETSTRHVPLSHRTQVVHEGWGWIDSPQAGLASPKWAEAPDTLPTCSVDKATTTFGNPHLSITLEADGSLTLTEHATGQRHTQQHVGVYSVDKGDSYNRCPALAGPIERWELKNVKWLTEGSAVVRVQASYAFASRQHPSQWVRCTLTLRADSPALTIDTQWQPPDPNRLWQVSFAHPTPLYGIEAWQGQGWHWQAAEPHPTPYPLPDAPQGTLNEWLPVGGAHQGALRTPALALLAAGLPDYTVNPETHTLNLTLHRGFGAISGGKLPSRSHPAGPPLATPQGQGTHRKVEARYVWLPAGTVATPEALAWQQALTYGGIEVRSQAQLAHASQAPTASVPWVNGLVRLSWRWLPSLTLPTHVAKAVGQATKAGFIVRWLNPSDAPVTVSPAEMGLPTPPRHCWPVLGTDAPCPSADPTATSWDLPARGVLALAWL